VQFAGLPSKSLAVSRTTPVGLRSRKRLCSLLVFLSLLIWVAPSHADEPPVSPDVVAGLKSLKTANETQRQSVYDLIAQKGDARLIPALKAYRDGSLQLRDDRLCIFGDRTNVPGKGSVLPLVDAITTEPIAGPDGAPIYFPKPDLSKALRAPPRAEKSVIADLISTLSLLDPNPEARVASIRDVSERSARAFIDVVDQQRFADRMTRSSAAFNAANSEAFTKAAAAIDDALKQRPKKLTDAVPDAATTGRLFAILSSLQLAGTPTPSLGDALNATRDYQDRQASQQKVLDELPKYASRAAPATGGESNRQICQAAQGSDGMR